MIKEESPEVEEQQFPELHLYMIRRMKKEIAKSDDILPLRKARVYLGSRFHIKANIQIRILNEFVQLGLLERFSRKQFKILI